MSTTTNAGDSLGLRPGDFPPELALPAAPERTYDTLDTDADEWESRVGVSSLDAELHLFRQHTDKIAPLAAIFDGGQTPLADGMRKQHRAWVGTQLVQEGAAPENVAETKLERMANVDPRHLRYVNALRKLREVYVLLRGDEKRLQARAYDRGHRCSSYSSESRMTR